MNFFLVTQIAEEDYFFCGNFIEELPYSLLLCCRWEKLELAQYDIRYNVARYSVCQWKKRIVKAPRRRLISISLTTTTWNCVRALHSAVSPREIGAEKVILVSLWHEISNEVALSAKLFIRSELDTKYFSCGIIELIPYFAVGYLLFDTG